MSDRFDEGLRAAAIEEHNLDGGSSPDLNFDELTGFAAELCEAPIALVSLVEERRQRFLSKVGLAVSETPREVSFCAHAMCEPNVMVVPDARKDPRFAGNPLVTNAPFIRFYAGAPLVTQDGIPLGSLCVIDDKPRAGLSELQLRGLKVLARQVMARFETRRTEKATWLHEIATKQTLAESEQKFQILADAMPQMVWSTLPDGHHDYYNARWYEFTGVPNGSTDGEGWNGMFHPDDQERAWEKWRHSLATGEPYEIEYRLRNASGAYRWTLGRALPMRDKAGQITRWFGTCTDIHDQKMLMEQREIISQELSHRIKNIFAVVGGLIAFSSRAHPDMAPLAGELRARVMALGKAHDFVRPHSTRSRPAGNKLTLKGLLSELLAAYQDANSSRIIISGDDVGIDDRSATPLALVFHELATNAAKYGALSSVAGHVEISISVSDADVEVTWRELGGPEVLDDPGKMGFGSRLIELAIESQLSGRLAQSWKLTGLSAVASIPMASIRP
jgi:PAS domain S-box-containing protein